MGTLGLITSIHTPMFLVLRYAWALPATAVGLPILGQVRSHEHVHVQQYERWGVLFFPLYVASSVVQLVRGRNPYLNNCFEREAYARVTPKDAAWFDES